jgi:hypothetical protein
MSAKHLSNILSQTVQGGANAVPAKTSVRRGPAKGKKTPGLYDRLAKLYADMESAYNASAQAAGLSCAGCEDNCCTSFFQHHTYVEWAYLQRGLQSLPDARRKAFVKRAEAYVEAARQSLARNTLPTAMCPVNEDGLCALYPYRLMICRLHGTRNVFTLPDGAIQTFPGCYRFAALPCAQGESADCPTVDRTPLYQELAALELEFQKKAGKALPRVNITIAEMIVLGPPRIR